MRKDRLAFIMFLMLTVAPARGQNVLTVVTVAGPNRVDPPCVPCPSDNGAAPSSPLSPAEPKQPADPNLNAPNMFAGATEAGTQPGAMFNPNVFGDLLGISGRQTLTIPGQFVNVPITSSSTAIVNSAVTTMSVNNRTTPPVTTVTNTATTTTTTTNSIAFVKQPATLATQGVPIFGQYSGFKITDNESPRPVDRIFATYNYFNEINRALIPGSIPSINASRELFGFEKTFLGGDASFGMRLPYMQFYGLDNVQSQSIGDLNFLFKYAWINDRETGNVLSTGMVVTLPTGGAGQVTLADGSIAPHATLLQPWGGFIYNWSQMFLQGFTSLVLPTDQRDPTIFFNSIAAGWWAYRSNDNRLLSAFAPVAELHLSTPFNHSSPNDTIYVQDQLNATVGAYTILRRVAIGTAIGVPLLGPRPFHVEAITSFNLRF